MTRKPCKFAFDNPDATQPDEVFDGFETGEKPWNGFDIVAVTKETLERIIGQSADINDAETVAAFREIEPDADGLFNLGAGWTTTIIGSEGDA